jgi:D-3-phosphoglycerate dehydrogenase
LKENLRNQIIKNSMKFRILANDGISAEGAQLLEKAGHEVITDTVAQDKLADYINAEGVEVLLVRSATQVRKDLIDACPGLEMIGRGGVGMDNIDVEYARSKGKFVFNTPASSSQSVAELVFAHLFGIARFLYDSNRQMPTNGKSNFKNLKKAYGAGIELRGKTMGIIGFGRIGQATAQYALGLGMNVIAVDSDIRNVQISLPIGGESVEVILSTSTMDELLRRSDFISIHVPKQADGGAVIGDAEIAKMKKGVVLINTARGGVINEDALLNGLNSGVVAAAGLDVFENEPNPDERLLVHPKISLTPHIGAATEEAQDRIGAEIAQIIIKQSKVRAS